MDTSSSWINIIMEKYTAKQWSEIQGGHTMSNNQETKFGFISDLNESRMYRTKQSVVGTNARDMADFAFMNMLAVYILSKEYDFAPAMQGYAKRTMMFGNFTAYRQTGTDLYIALNSLQNNSSGTGDKDKIQNSRISLPDQKIKVFLRQIMTGRPVLNPSAFFLALERGLDVQSSNYRSVRRLAQDWDRLNGMQKSLVVTRMLQFFRSKALRSELYTYIRDMSRTQGLEIKGAGNAEEPKARGVDTLKSVAANVAVAAGGFAAGRAFGRRIAK